MDREELILFDGHPSWRSTPGFHVKGIAAAVIAGAIAGIATAVAAGHVQAGWVIVAVVAVFAFVLVSGAVRRTRTTYMITNERLMIKRGLLARNHHETRLDRVQNVASRQSMLERLLGVGTIEFDTAGEADYDFSFQGVANPREIMRAVDAALRNRPRELQPRELPRTRRWLDRL